MKKWSIIALVFALTITFSSCRDNDPEEFEIIIEWIWEGMNEIYLWNEEIDPSLYPTDETQPEEFFYSLLVPEDRFSWIVDDYEALKNSFAGIEKSTGISPLFIGIAGSNDVIAVVEYVAEGSPADSAGVLRGDIITDINGSGMTASNYRDKFFAEEVTLEFADYFEGALYSNDKLVTLQARVIDQNPVQHAEIFNYEGSKIGYLVYTQFTTGTSDKWLDELDNALLDFRDAGIDAMVVDLRYNPGGSIFMASHLASALAPSDIPGSDNVFVYFQWNDLYQEYIEAEEGEDSPYLVTYFEDSSPFNLSLSEVYFLTSTGTASASELTIIGLEPYLDQVTVIGDTTYGKPFGSVTLPDVEEPPRHNWAMQPIVFKYANSLGFSDFASGLVPDYPMYDNILEAKPFGDITDPMVAKALELITGVSPLTTKSALPAEPKYRIHRNPVFERKTNAILDDRLLRE